MGLFEMLRRRESAESVTESVASVVRPVAATAESQVGVAQTRLVSVLPSSSARSPAGRLDRRLAAASQLRAPSPGSPATSPVTAPVDPSAAFRDTEVRPDALSHFHQLPPYQALLTVGPEAVYQLPAPLHEKLIALDCGARQARLVRARHP
jgi:hypothetical protein